MQINGKYPINTCNTEHVGNQLRRYGYASRTYPPILASIPVVWNNSSNAIGRCSTHGVNHDQQVHQVIVGRVTGWLNDKDIATAHVFQYFD